MTVFFRSASASNQPAVPTGSTTTSQLSTSTPSPTTSAPTPSSTSSSAPSKSTDTDTSTRTVTIDMKHIHSSEILSRLLDVTDAVAVAATPEEEAQMQMLAARRRTSERDAARSATRNQKLQREKDVLAQARGDIAAQSSTATQLPA